MSVDAVEQGPGQKADDAGRAVGRPSGGAEGRASEAAAWSDPPRAGPRLKHARLVKGYTLKQLALEVKCSESMISKLENGKLSPSISLLHRLASALGTSMAELLVDSGPQPEASGVAVFRPGNRARFEVDPSSERNGSWFEKLLPIQRGGLLQANILNIPAGAATTSFVRHDGEEFGFVIEGEIDVIVDGRSHHLEKGDVIYFSSSLDHGYRNTSGRVAQVLWVNTPPTL